MKKAIQSAKVFHIRSKVFCKIYLYHLTQKEIHGYNVYQKQKEGDKVLASYILKGCIELFALHTILQAIFHAELRDKQTRRILFLTYLLITIGQVYFMYVTSLTSLIFCLMTFIATLSYKMALQNRLLSTALSFLISGCSEGLVWLVLQYIMHTSVTDVAPTSIFFPFTTILTAIMQLAVVLAIVVVMNYFLRKPPHIYVTVTLILSILGILSIELFVTFADTQYMPAAIIAILLILFCAAMCGGLLRDQLRVQQERLRLEFLEQQSTDQIEHYTALYQHSRDIHKLRHDMKNFVLSADSLLQQEQYDALHKHFVSFLDSVHPPVLTDTGNPLLDAVLSAKRADAPHIPFHLQIPALSYAQIDPMDVAMLLATALDNAIAGCKEEQSPYILVKITQHEQMLSLYVENPTHQPLITKRNRLISQKANPARHGYGMQGMERIAQKYHGSLDWKCENGVFELRVLVQDLPSAKVSVQSSNL